VLVAGQQVAEQRDLQGAIGRKVGVAPFGRESLVALPLPNEIGLAQTGAGRNDADRAARLGLAGMEGCHIFFFEDGYGRGHRLQVVEQVGAFKGEGLFQLAPIEYPGQVGNGRAVAHHRAGDAKYGVADLDIFGLEIAGDDCFQRGVVLAGKQLFVQRVAGAGFLGKEGEHRFCPADIASK
jgi:hypothetical protein